MNQTQPSATHFSASRLPSPLCFLVGILLFFLPFLDIKCNTVSVQKLSGIQLATGFKISPLGNDETLVGKLEESSFGGDMKPADRWSRKDANTFAMIALGLALLGLILSILSSRTLTIAAMVSGILAGAALIGAYIDIGQKLKTEIMQESQRDVIIRIDFTPWFYISVLLFFAAAVFSYRRGRMNAPL